MVVLLVRAPRLLLVVLRDLDTTERESSVLHKTKMTTVVLPRHNRVC